MENLFQGPRFEKAITIFTKKERQFGCLDLNKILLHAVFSQIEIINDFDVINIINNMTVINNMTIVY